MFAVESPGGTGGVGGGRKKNSKSLILHCPVFKFARLNVRCCQLKPLPCRQARTGMACFPLTSPPFPLPSAWRGCRDCRPHSPWSVYCVILFLRLTGALADTFCTSLSLPCRMVAATVEALECPDTRGHREWRESKWVRESVLLCA